jgi:NhaP-type Na+/H+ or K+/H+ antiporter
MAPWPSIAILASGGGPEILSVLLEGESLFNDASSLTLFEVFKEVILHAEHTTLGEDLQRCGTAATCVWRMA